MRDIKKKIVILNVEIVLLFILICILFILLLSGRKESNAGEVINISETKQIEEKHTDKESKLEKEAKKIYKKNEKYLLLVNKDNRVPDDYNSKLIDVCEGRLQASEWLYEDLREMLKDADENGHTFFIASAYRSSERQQNLVDEDVEVFMNQGMKREAALEETLKETMPSGYSEHQTGLALDILASDNLNMDRTQETAEGNKWLQEKCMNYGFILRYPDEKEMITKISYEPWHFRYVGREAAQFISENNLTLEEFVQLVGK